jgi:hypothetical protein
MSIPAGAEPILYVLPDGSYFADPDNNTPDSLEYFSRIPDLLEAANRIVRFCTIDGTFHLNNSGVDVVRPFVDLVKAMRKFIPK